MSDRAALATWQQALKLVRAKGIPRENREGVEMLIYKTEGLTAYTPAKDERPNGLDIWRHDADRKVLDVIWTDGTMPIIVRRVGTPAQVVERVTRRTAKAYVMPKR